MNKLKKNIIFSVTYQLLIIFLPLITSVHLSNVIGAEGIGQYSYSYSIALYFTYFVLLGLNKYGNRVIASVQENRKKRSLRFCELYAIQALCFIPVVLLYVLYALFVAEARSTALIQTIFILSALFDINWFFFGMEMFDKTVIRNLFVKVSITVSIVVCVRDKADVDRYAFIMSLGYLVSQLMLWPYVLKLVDLEKIHFRDLSKHIKPNLTLFLPVIAISLYKVMDKIMLGFLDSTASVGFYENAERIINIPIAIITALGNVMLPRTTALLAQAKVKQASQYQNRTMLIVIAFTVLLVFGLLSCGETLVLLLYGESFQASIPVLKYLAVTIIFLGVGNVIRTQFLIPHGYDRVYITSAFLGAIVNFVINILLIDKYGATGAAIGTIGAEFIVCIYQMFCIRKEIPLQKYTFDLALCIVSGIIMFVLLSLLPTFGSAIIQLLVAAVLGSSIYIFLLAIYYFFIGRKRI